MTTATRSRRTATVDSVCAEAIELAREAAERTAPTAAEVGEHAGVVADDERVVTHYFECLSPAYRGWRWAVTVARASRSRTVTVDEVVLLPGSEAILAPEWVPWSERLRPGDLGIGDILPTREDDERLVPGYTALDEGDAEDSEEGLVAYELGLTGRPRVLSLYGRDVAAERWYTGESGPDAPIAQAAPARCSTCGFLVRIGGAMGQLFGACGNEYSPSDGRVVALNHGCGAHSEAAVIPKPPEVGPMLMDDLAEDEPAEDADNVEDVADAED